MTKPSPYVAPSDIDGLLLGYASGRLHPALRVLADTHMALRPGSRHMTRRAEAVGGAALEALPMATLGGGALARALHAIDHVERARARNTPAAAWGEAGQIPTTPPSGGGGAEEGADVLPPPLAQALQRPIGDIAWRRVLPGMREHRVVTLSDETCEAKLIRFDAGRKTIEHAHHGAEVTLVLVGAYADHTGVYRRGDVQCVGADVSHQPVVLDQADCVCFTVATGGVRVANPFWGMMRYLIQ